MTTTTPTPTHGAGDQLFEALETLEQLTAPPRSFADFMNRALQNVPNIGEVAQ